ncbi:hypothetical protein QFC21_005865 [Naganishia friedmannii]|uniref:Uncharacterized protein n=1 Tax=Naganishia friedmannii TaxID=89922 RepID=A0ACC2V6G6_9TREE|nr:hypothetical protein QFC21_005865 [Naganishia friedmannii]
MRRVIISCLAAVVITLSLVITFHRPAQPFPDHAWFHTLTSSYQPPIRSSNPANACADPYALPGILQVNATHLHENRWIPFAHGCEAPRLVDALLNGTGDMDWARNRTVVVFGDSVARENVAYFCELFDAKLDRITWDHAYAPSPVPSHTPPPLALAVSATPTPRDPDADPDLAGNWKAKQNIGNGDQTHLAHVCFVDRFGLLLVQQFQYGMDQEDVSVIHIALTRLLTGEVSRYAVLGIQGTFEDRLQALVHPIVHNAMRALQPTSEPDLVMLNSALWDTARWVREDMRFARDLDAGLTRERLDWYRARIQQVVLAVAKVYPQAAISWVTNHYPTANGPSDWFTAGVPVTTSGKGKSGARPGNTVLRLTQLDAAVRSAFTARWRPCIDTTCTLHEDTLRHVRLNEWGRIMLGQEKHMKDALHQALIPGGRLWADMMLYDLWRAVDQPGRGQVSAGSSGAGEEVAGRWRRI